MAYDPGLYNPYGSRQFQPTNQGMNWQYQPTVTVPQSVQQPINGLQFIEDASVLNTLRMPPGSTSQPYFLKGDNKFIIVTFDNVGGSTMETFSFTKDPVDNGGDFVTREYFDQQINSIMEAINGKHVIQGQAETAINPNANVTTN